MEEVRWRDTPEETITRASLRVQPGDFTEVQTSNPASFRAFILSRRIASGLLVRNEASPDPRVLRLANPDIVNRLRDKLRGILGGQIQRAQFQPYEVIDEDTLLNAIDITTNNYDITIGDADEPGDIDLSIILQRNATQQQRAAFLQTVERIKEAVADVALADARKKFVKGKTLSRVGQRIGLDPLAFEAEIAERVGGRRRKTKTNKKRSTRRR